MANPQPNPNPNPLPPRQRRRRAPPQHNISAARQLLETSFPNFTTAYPFTLPPIVARRFHGCTFLHDNESTVRFWIYIAIDELPARCHPTYNRGDDGFPPLPPRRPYLPPPDAPDYWPFVAPPPPMPHFNGIDFIYANLHIFLQWYFNVTPQELADGRLLATQRTRHRQQHYDNLIEARRHRQLQRVIAYNAAAPIPPLQAPVLQRYFAAAFAAQQALPPPPLFLPAAIQPPPPPPAAAIAPPPVFPPPVYIIDDEDDLDNPNPNPNPNV